MPPVDVLVVGLGPGGGSAARIAAEGGARVLAVDRRAVVGEPVQCAEFIPLPMGRHARDASVYCQPITGMTTYLPSGMGHDSDFPGIMIHRGAFDRAIARRAEQAGAGLWTGATLVGLDPAARLARIRRGKETHCITYRVLVAADGPHSPVAAHLGLPALATVQTRQYTVPLLKAHQETDIWLSGDYPGGYAWLFPKGKEANLGLGIDKRLAPDLKVPLDALHRTLVREGRVGPEILRRTGGAIPVGGMREALVHGTVLFVGDAAGLTHPITGGGIAPAVISGERAGAAALACLRGEDSALTDYEEEIRDLYQPGLDRAVIRRRELIAAWQASALDQDAPHRRGWIAFPEYLQAANQEHTHAQTSEERTLS